LHSYYQIYDFGNNAIGFNGDYVDFYPDRPKPINTTGNGNSFLIVLIVVLGVLAILGIGFFIYRR
jgi:hypothetical protein